MTRYTFRINAHRDSLDYFNTKSQAESPRSNPSMSIQLSNLISVKRFDDNAFQLDAGPDGVFLLRTDSQAQFTCWMEGLETYIRSRKVHTYVFHMSYRLISL